MIPDDSNSDQGLDSELRFVGSGDGDRTVPSEHPLPDPPIWARFLINQVQWLTTKVLTLKTRCAMLEYFLDIHGLDINIPSWYLYLNN